MDLNKVVLMGHIGKEPGYHIMQSGAEMCKFSMATTRKWKDKATGERREDTSWHNIVVFSPYLVTHVCHVFLQKGTFVYLEGEIKTRSYEKDGEKRYITEIIVPAMKGEIYVLAKGRGWDTNETPGSERNRGGSSDGPQQAGIVARQIGGGDFDDDIPF